MPNHYTHVVTCFPRYVDDDRDDDALTDQLTAWATDGCARVRPMPEALRETRSPTLRPDHALIAEHGADNWYDWQRQNWGIKWGIYDVQAAKDLPGDGGPCIVTFCTAWGPPNEEVRALLLAELHTFAEGVTWVGMDPRDHTATILHQDPREER